jgi:hypothetical protein
MSKGPACGAPASGACPRCGSFVCNDHRRQPLSDLRICERCEHLAYSPPRIILPVGLTAVGIVLLLIQLRR